MAKGLVIGGHNANQQPSAEVVDIATGTTTIDSRSLSDNRSSCVSITDQQKMVSYILGGYSPDYVLPYQFTPVRYTTGSWLFSGSLYVGSTNYIMSYEKYLHTTGTFTSHNWLINVGSFSTPISFSTTAYILNATTISLFNYSSETIVTSGSVSSVGDYVFGTSLVFGNTSGRFVSGCSRSSNIYRVKDLVITNPSGSAIISQISTKLHQYNCLAKCGVNINSSQNLLIGGFGNQTWNYSSSQIYYDNSYYNKMELVTEAGTGTEKIFLNDAKRGFSTSLVDNIDKLDDVYVIGGINYHYAPNGPGALNKHLVISRSTLSSRFSTYALNEKRAMSTSFMLFLNTGICSGSYIVQSENMTTISVLISGNDMGNDWSYTWSSEQSNTHLNSSQQTWLSLATSESLNLTIQKQNIESTFTIKRIGQRLGYSDCNVIIHISVPREEKLYPDTNQAYFGGGLASSSTIISTDTIDGMDLVLDTGFEVLSHLSTARSWLAAFSEQTFGYFINGKTDNGVESSIIDDFVYATQVCNQHQISIAYASDSQCTLYSSSRGYLLGGSRVLNGIQTMSWASRTFQGAGYGLTYGRELSHGVWSHEKGYIGRGVSTQTENIEVIRFSDNTLVDYFSKLQSLLSISSTEINGVSSTNKGYFWGGYLNIEGLVFDNETIDYISVTNFYDRYNYQTSAASSNNGFFAGGTVSNVKIRHIQKFNFNTEKLSVASALLQLARKNLASVYQPITAPFTATRTYVTDAGYLAGCSNSVSYDGHILKLYFSTNTLIQAGFFLEDHRGQASGVQSKDNGYILHGNSSSQLTPHITNVIQFANESYKRLSIGVISQNKIYSSASASSSEFGYTFGGFERVTSAIHLISDIYKFSFASESGSIASQSLSIVRALGQAVHSTEKAYISGGQNIKSSNLRLASTESITFLTEDVVTHSYALKCMKCEMATCQSSFQGFFMGGFVGQSETNCSPNTSTNMIDGLDYVDGSYVEISSALHVKISDNTGLNSKTDGYSCFGTSAIIDQLNMTTYTVSEVSENFTITFNHMTGVQQEHLESPPVLRPTDYGFFAGGMQYGFQHVKTVEELFFKTDVVSLSLQSLSETKSGCGSVMNEFKGLVVGGLKHTTYQTGIDSFRFIDRTISLSSSTLSYPCHHSCGINNEIHGYILGGMQSDTFSFQGEKFNIDNGFISTGTFYLAIPRTLATPLSANHAGYILGGLQHSLLSSIESFQFSTETSSVIATQLQPPQSSATGTYQTTVGFIAGGSRLTNYSDDIDTFNFIHETLQSNVAQLPVLQFLAGSVSSSENNYFAGGQSTNVSSSIHKHGLFSNSTIQTQALKEAKTELVGLCSKNLTVEIQSFSDDYGYIFTGFTTTNYTNNTPFIDEVHLFTLTSKELLNTLNWPRPYSAGFANEHLGYIAGGEIKYTALAIVEKFNFTSKIVTQLSHELLIRRTEVCGLTSQCKGYISSGMYEQYPIDLVKSKVMQSMNYSNETFAIVSYPMASNRIQGSGLYYSTKGFFCGSNHRSTSEQNTLDGLHFITEVTESILHVLTQKYSDHFTIQNVDHGYLGGSSISGSQLIEKFSYVTETSSMISISTASMQESCSLRTTSQGLICGGTSSALIHIFHLHTEILTTSQGTLSNSRRSGIGLQREFLNHITQNIKIYPTYENQIYVSDRVRFIPQKGDKTLQVFIENQTSNILTKYHARLKVQQWDDLKDSEFEDYRTMLPFEGSRDQKFFYDNVNLTQQIRHNYITDIIDSIFKWPLSYTPFMEEKDHLIATQIELVPLISPLIILVIEADDSLVTSPVSFSVLIDGINFLTVSSQQLSNNTYLVSSSRFLEKDHCVISLSVSSLNIHGLSRHAFSNYTQVLRFDSHSIYYKNEENMQFITGSTINIKNAGARIILPLGYYCNVYRLVISKTNQKKKHSNITINDSITCSGIWMYPPESINIYSNNQSLVQKMNITQSVVVYYDDNLHESSSTDIETHMPLFQQAESQWIIPEYKDGRVHLNTQLVVYKNETYTKNASLSPTSIGSRSVWVYTNPLGIPAHQQFKHSFTYQSFSFDYPLGTAGTFNSLLSYGITENTGTTLSNSSIISWCRFNTDRSNYIDYATTSHIGHFLDIEAIVTDRPYYTLIDANRTSTQIIAMYHVFWELPNEPDWCKRTKGVWNFSIPPNRGSVHRDLQLAKVKGQYIDQGNCYFSNDTLILDSDHVANFVIIQMFCHYASHNNTSEIIESYIDIQVETYHITMMIRCNQLSSQITLSFLFNNMTQKSMSFKKSELETAMIMISRTSNDLNDLQTFSHRHINIEVITHHGERIIFSKSLSNVTTWTDTITIVAGYSFEFAVPQLNIL